MCVLGQAASTQAASLGGAAGCGACHPGGAAAPSGGSADRIARVSYPHPFSCFRARLSACASVPRPAPPRRSIFPSPRACAYAPAWTAVHFSPAARLLPASAFRPTPFPEQERGVGPRDRPLIYNQSGARAARCTLRLQRAAHSHVARHHTKGACRPACLGCLSACLSVRGLPAVPPLRTLPGAGALPAVPWCPVPWPAVRTRSTAKINIRRNPRSNMCV